MALSTGTKTTVSTKPLETMGVGIITLAHPTPMPGQLGLANQISRIHDQRLREDFLDIQGCTLRAQLIAGDS